MVQRGYGRPIRGQWESHEDRDFGDYRTRDRDERWSGRDRDEDRGFFEKAGDEVRSWFSDEEDRRSERSRQPRSSMSSDLHDRDFDTGSRRPDYGRGDFSRSSATYGSSDRRPSLRFGQNSGDSDRNRQRDDDDGSTGFLLYEEFTGTLGGFGDQRVGRPEDQLYRNWRDRQIKQLDREYQEYCREREQQFQQDFDQWRRSRREKMGEKGELQLGSAGSGTREIGNIDPAANASSQGENMTSEPQSSGSSKSSSRPKS